MSRPRGPIRDALARAAEELAPLDAPGVQGVTWRELVRKACVGEVLGRRCVVDMQRAGELVVVGRRALPGVCRPVNLYARRPDPQPDDAVPQLLALQRAWAREPA